MSTERDRMIAGERYDPCDATLAADRACARDLCWALNATAESQPDERRRLLTNLFGAGGDTASIQSPFHCDYGHNIALGERVYFNFNCVVLDVCPVHIGSFSMFGPAVQIDTALHPLDAVAQRGEEYGKPVRIGSDVWVGGGAIIQPGVTIGSRTVIGAGSVVTRDIPDDMIAVGNPCRVLRAIPRAS